MDEESGKRLNGWKAIGTFVGRDARTARRWEAERGLPVNRIPGGGSASVWADPAELKSWIGQAGPEPDQDSTDVPLSRRLLKIWPWFAGLAIVAAGIALFVGSSARPSADTNPYGNDAKANALYRTAMLAVERRNAPGLNQAEADLAKLAISYPKNPAAFVGLAETDLLLREFNALPAETAYRRATLAAEQALALDPDSYRAKRALAFIRYWNNGKRAEGLDLFKQAITLNPDDALSHHWFGTALMGEGQYEESLKQLDAAAMLNPGSSAVAADRAYGLYLTGQHQEAKAVLTQLVQIDRGFSGSHYYLERIAFIEGEDAAYLAEAETTARLRGQFDRLDVVLAAKKAFAAGGRKAMLASLIASEEHKFEQDEESALRLATLEGAAGNVGKVRHWLTKAIEIKEPGSESLPAYIEFQRFAGMPGYEVLLKPH